MAKPGQIGTLAPPPTSADPERFLTVDELAERWRKSPKSVKRLVGSGLMAVRIGRDLRFPFTAVLQYEARNTRMGMAVIDFGSAAIPSRNGASVVSVAAPVPSRCATYSICLAHRKGGQLKTTSTYFLAMELARSGRRVICRDLDKQQSLTHVFRDTGAAERDGAMLLSKRVALVPDGAPVPFRRPDVELIDTPPDLDGSITGLMRADGLIIPALPEHPSLRALQDMFEALDANAARLPKLRFLGVLPTRYNARWSAHRDALKQLEAIAHSHNCPMLPPVPMAPSALSYSNRGSPWRPAAEQIIAVLVEEASRA